MSGDNSSKQEKKKLKKSSAEIHDDIQIFNNILRAVSLGGKSMWMSPHFEPLRQFVSEVNARPAVFPNSSKQEKKAEKATQKK